MNNFNRQGWVRIYRKSIDSTVWQNPVIWMVWSWCLLRANHQPNKFLFNGQDIEILPGQFITGINKAVTELGKVSPQNYRTAIKYLKSTGRLTVQSNNKFSIITIVNWDKYQKDNSLDNKPLTNDQQATNKPLTTNKKYKNDKKDKNNTILADKSAGKTRFNPLGAEILKAFEDVDPKNKTYYCNTTQRSACDYLLETYGLEEVLKRITVLPKTNRVPFFPKINSPNDLKEKWVKLQDAVEAKRAEIKNNNKIAF